MTDVEREVLERGSMKIDICLCWSPVILSKISDKTSEEKQLQVTLHHERKSRQCELEVAGHIHRLEWSENECTHAYVHLAFFTITQS